MSQLHREHYVHLADVTHDAALVSWGAFEFRKRSGAHSRLVDDEKLSKGRKETIGASSRPYGTARVVVYDSKGDQAASATTSDANHVWLRDLAPDTEYRYEITIDGRRWAEGTNLDWSADPGSNGGHLEDLGRRYDNRFRTHPDPEKDADLTFAVLGDFGVGVGLDSPDSRRQRRVAEALETAVNRHAVRLVLTTGDNVYLAQPEQFSAGGTGDEDDDWFFPFYQPYRYVLNRVPFYPSVGNHDASDTERSDDRNQLNDNYYIDERFAHAEIQGRASLDPGLFYRFGYGSNVEFVAIDSTLASPLETERWFDDAKHLDYLRRTFAPDRARNVRWQFPFTHHPPFCAGPHHNNDRRMIDTLIPLFEQAQVRAMFSGHEHNFQYSSFHGVHYFVSGAGGKLRGEKPEHFEAAHTAAWAVDGHFLIVRVRADRTEVMPVCAANGAELEPLQVYSSSGDPVQTPFVIEAKPR